MQSTASTHIDEGWPEKRPTESFIMKELLAYARGGARTILTRYFEERPQLATDVGTGAGDEPMTLLMAGAYTGQGGVVERCLEKGASPNATNAMGKTTVHFAASGAQPYVVQLLLDHGADATLRTLDSPNNPTGNMTPLMFAVRSTYGHKRCIETIKILLSKCNNINERGPGGATALWLACARGRPKVVKALLKLGADPFIWNSDGVLPGQAAKESRSDRCANAMHPLQQTEGEFHRAYLVYRARCIRDAFTTRLALADAPLPPYLATRAMGVKELPIVELKSKYRGGWKRKGGRGDVLREADTRLMVTVDYVTRGLDNRLFLELMMYFPLTAGWIGSIPRVVDHSSHT